MSMLGCDSNWCQFKCSGLQFLLPQMAPNPMRTSTMMTFVNVTARFYYRWFTRWLSLAKDAYNCGLDDAIPENEFCI